MCTRGFRTRDSFLLMLSLGMSQTVLPSLMEPRERVPFCGGLTRSQSPARVISDARDYSRPLPKKIVNNLDISPLLAILRRVTSRLLVLAFVCACLTSTLVYPVFAQQPAPAAGGSALDAATQQQVTDLKLQAQDAFEAKDLPKALALYKRILRLNPDDPLALKRSEELTEAVAKQTE